MSSVTVNSPDVQANAKSSTVTTENPSTLFPYNPVRESPNANAAKVSDANPSEPNRTWKQAFKSWRKQAGIDVANFGKGFSGIAAFRTSYYHVLGAKAGRTTKTKIQFNAETIDPASFKSRPNGVAKTRRQANRQSKAEAIGLTASVLTAGIPSIIGGLAGVIAGGIVRVVRPDSLRGKDVEKSEFTKLMRKGWNSSDVEHTFDQCLRTTGQYVAKKTNSVEQGVSMARTSCPSITSRYHNRIRGYQAMLQHHLHKELSVENAEFMLALHIADQHPTAENLRFINDTFVATKSDKEINVAGYARKNLTKLNKDLITTMGPNSGSPKYEFGKPGQVVSGSARTVESGFKILSKVVAYSRDPSRQQELSAELNKLSKFSPQMKDQLEKAASQRPNGEMKISDVFFDAQSAVKSNLRDSYSRY
ncbi:hypothetical protein [Roseiconus lacunae]|uniref:hypothetical protein n=1 Tax=Roseiconus lacunae TaxID=2605694 RepID=UPI001E625A6A|nr:hypothetical protein [Roseiconus lacunae]MCD0457884.1 hypothetical protein [Roseiconus lacunae]